MLSAWKCPAYSLSHIHNPPVIVMIWLSLLQLLSFKGSPCQLPTVYIIYWLSLAHDHGNENILVFPLSACLLPQGGTLFTWGLQEWRLARNTGDNSIPEAALLNIKVGRSDQCLFQSDAAFVSLNTVRCNERCILS
jgi:hypothetical protein